MKKNKGWVKLWRDQFNNWISKTPFCDGYAWCYLYAQANHKDGMANFRNEYIQVKRGQLVTSKLKLSRLFRWGRKKTNSFLTALKRDNMITYRSTNRYILITIINYELYQQVDTKKDNRNTNRKDNRRTTDGQQTDTNKNYKNYKKEKEKDHDPLQELT